MGSNEVIEIQIKENEEEEEEKVHFELPFPFEKEIYEKQCKRIYIVEKFEPTDRVIPITEKFYSRHDNNKLKLNNSNYMPVIEERYKLPHEKYEKPLLESHTIGWNWHTNKSYLNGTVNRIFAPKLRCDLTVFGEYLCKEKTTERPEFIGETFFLR